MDCRRVIWKRAFFSDRGRNAPGTASTVTRREHCGQGIAPNGVRLDGYSVASAPVVRTGAFRSSSDGVLVQNSAESVDSADRHRVIEWILRNVRDRDLKIDSAVRPCSVVMLDEHLEHALKVTLASDEQQSRHSRRAVPTNRSANALARGARTGVLMTRAPIEVMTSSKRPTNLVSLSRIKNLTALPSSSSVIARLRACWVTQLPMGCSVTPARKTLRRSRSMKNNT